MVLVVVSIDSMDWKFFIQFKVVSPGVMVKKFIVFIIQYH